MKQIRCPGGPAGLQRPGRLPRCPHTEQQQQLAVHHTSTDPRVLKPRLHTDGLRVIDVAAVRR